MMVVVQCFLQWNYFVYIQVLHRSVVQIKVINDLIAPLNHSTEERSMMHCGSVPECSMGKGVLVDV